MAQATAGVRCTNVFCSNTTISQAAIPNLNVNVAQGIIMVCSDYFEVQSTMFAAVRKDDSNDVPW